MHCAPARRPLSLPVFFAGARASVARGAWSMKILVAVKRVIDYNVKVRVKSDQSGV